MKNILFACMIFLASMTAFAQTSVTCQVYKTVEDAAGHGVTTVGGSATQVVDGISPIESAFAGYAYHVTVSNDGSLYMTLKDQNAGRSTIFQGMSQILNSSIPAKLTLTSGHGAQSTDSSETAVLRCQQN